MEVGIKNKIEIIVTEDMTAEAMGSGLLPVFGTPYLIALMEDTARHSIENDLEEGLSTVGTKVNVEHVSATPIGMKVTCESELIEIDRKRLVFKVEAYDEVGLIGTGTHERFIIDNEKFMSKAKGKL